MLRVIKNLPLRQRAAINFAVICIVLFSLVYYYSSQGITKGFIRLEEENAKTNLLRVNDAIAETGENLISVLSGYSQWDDAYEYIKIKKDLAFEKSNLSVSLTTLGIEIFSYWALENELIWGSNLNIKTDEDSKKLYPMHPSDIKTLELNKQLHKCKNFQDYKYIFLKLVEGPFLIVSVPVTSTDGKAPINGNLIGAKMLNADYFALLSKRLHLEIEAIYLQPLKVNSKETEIIKQLAFDNFHIERLNEKTLQVYSLIKDNLSNDLVLIRISTSRDIYMQSQETLNNFLYTIIFSTIVLVIVILLLMNQLVLTKLEKLSGVIHNIIKTGNLNEKVPDMGNDEFGKLGAAFNAMTNEIDKLKSNAIYNEKMVSLGEMSGGIAHEINNPISIINVSVNLMKLMIQKNILEPQYFIKQTDIISETVTRISHIITGLKNISRDTSKEGFAPCSFKEIIEDALGVCSEKFKVNGVSIKINLDDTIYQTQIDCLRVQMSQVFINLLTNSFDAIANTHSPWVEISALKSQNTLSLIIKDSGLGIPREIQEKIFQPFFTTKEIGKGSGLGLSLCNSIIQRHSGTISINNESLNTCFVIKFLI